jgi:hypothetical protein
VPDQHGHEGTAAELRGFNRATRLAEAVPITGRDRVGTYQLPAREYRRNLLKALAEGRTP